MSLRLTRGGSRPDRAPRLTGLLLAMLALGVACSAPWSHPSPRAGHPTVNPASLDQDENAPIPAVQPSPVTGPMLAQGDPSALPGHLLIADRGNSRVIEVDPRGNIVWQFPPLGYHGQMAFDQPDDAFFSPDETRISTNQEFEHTIQVIDRRSLTVTWTYGTPYRAGAGPDQLNGPDDAFVLPDNRVVTADIKNCRVLFVNPDRTTTQIGHTGVCRHDPTNGYLAAPNGDAPDSGWQHLVVTEIGGSFVDVFSLPDAHLEYSFHSPAKYPSDAEMQPDGTFIMTDYVVPGAVYRIDRTGKLLWAFRDGLDHPSIAMGLPNGNVVISDDYGDRVMIVDPSTDHILWQYGVKNAPGVTAGHLNTPDGLDFLPNPAPVDAP